MKATLTDKVVTVDVLRENDAGKLLACGCIQCWLLLRMWILYRCSVFEGCYVCLCQSQKM